MYRNAAFPVLVALALVLPAAPAAAADEAPTTDVCAPVAAYKLQIVENGASYLVTCDPTGNNAGKLIDVKKGQWICWYNDFDEAIELVLTYRQDGEEVPARKLFNDHPGKPLVLAAKSWSWFEVRSYAEPTPGENVHVYRVKGKPDPAPAPTIKIKDD